MKAIFLDRDGTINVELGEGKMDSPDKIVLLPLTIDALKILAGLDYGVFIITNQLGIAMGNYNEEQFKKVNDEVLKQIAPSGIKVLKMYYCPHTADAFTRS